MQKLLSMRYILINGRVDNALAALPRGVGDSLGVDDPDCRVVPEGTTLQSGVT
jgi:hypothetical protein